MKYFTQITESKGGLNGNSSGWVRFYGWSALEEVDISNFTSIGHLCPYGYEDTFFGCTSLKKVIASDKLEVLGHRAFYDCPNLEEITNLNSNTITVRYGAFYNCQKLKTSTFANCEIFLPVAVSGQDSDWQFYNTKALTSITLSPQNTHIPKCCFYYSGLTSINIPSGVTEIREKAFCACTNLTTVVLPASVTSIGPDCFNECTSLANIDLSHLTFVDRLAFGSCAFTSANVSNVTSFGGRGIFEHCHSLATVSLSNSLTALTEQMFIDCPSLTTINIPSGVTVIPSACFRGCSNLTYINLSNITVFDDNCLSGCSSLTASDINWTNVTRIGGEAFKEVHIQQQNLVMPNLTFLGAWPFGNDNSSGITSVDFTGSTFTELQAGLFEGNRSIDHVTFPDSIVLIRGWGHFSSYASLRWVKFPTNSLIQFESGRNAGNLGIPSTSKIYVPDSLVASYKTDTDWTSVANRIFPMSQFSTDFPNG